MRPLRSRPFPLLPATRVVRTLLLPLLLLLVAGATSACLHRAKPGEAGAAEEDAPIPLPEFVFVNVDNRNFSDVVVSIVPSPGDGAQAFRIGNASGNSKTTLRFPGRYIAASAPLQLQAKAVGGRSVLLSERFTVQPGQQVSWTLETSFARSSLAVY